MIGFYIKKAFFDGWDNLIGLIILNLGFVISLGIAYAVFLSFQVHAVIGVVLLILYLWGLNIFIGGVSFYVKEFVFYQRPGAREFIDCLKSAWKPAVMHTIIMFILLVMIFFVIPFYASFEGLIGAVVIALLFWVSLFTAMGLMYYFPLIAQLEKNPKKAVKKSFLLVFDNIGFSFFLLLYTILNSIISILTAFLIPGFSSVLMSHQGAVKLLMFKYDYLEETPDANRKKIPWTALLFDEKEKVGHRSIRGMIFPWKE
ncbi:MAG: hypothetical protein K9L21_03010 [Spirochaetia bacterium]|nr:hypothetical protein [Spirochaetia bacterium]